MTLWPWTRSAVLAERCRHLEAAYSLLATQFADLKTRHESLLDAALLKNGATGAPLSPRSTPAILPMAQIFGKFGQREIPKRQEPLSVMESESA